MIQHAHSLLTGGTDKPRTVPTAWPDRVRQPHSLLDPFNAHRIHQHARILEHRDGYARLLGSLVCASNPVIRGERSQPTSSGEFFDIERVGLRHQKFHVCRSRRSFSLGPYSSANLTLTLPILEPVSHPYPPEPLVRQEPPIPESSGEPLIVPEPYPNLTHRLLETITTDTVHGTYVSRPTLRFSIAA